MNSNLIAEERRKKQKKGFFLGIIFALSLFFSIFALYLIFAPRWTQVGYSNLELPSFEGTYQYPKTEPYTMDYLLPIIASLFSMIGIIYGMFLYKFLRNNPIKRILRVLTKLSLISTILITASPVILEYQPFFEFHLDLEFMYYNAGPYLTWNNLDGYTQDPTNSITICWHSKYLTTSKVRYGTEMDKLNRTASISGLSRFHKVPINGLQPNITYYYKIDGFSLKEFTTAPIGTFNYTILLWSDPRTNDPYKNAINGINMPQIMSNHMSTLGINPAFTICAGDISSRGVDYQTWKLWLNDISTQDFASNRSHVVAMGNHERHDDAGGRNVRYYYPYQAKQDVQYSFSFNYGNTHYVILDRWVPETKWFYGSDLPHAQWLEQDLIENSGVDFTVLIIHTNPLLNDEHCGDCTNIMNVARNYGVDFIFCGHWHYYDTYDFNMDPVSPGIVSNLTIMNGNGGTYTNIEYNGYCQLDVNATALTIKARTADNIVPFEEYIILK